MSNLNIASSDILKYIEMLSSERNIQKDHVFQALESAFEDAVRKKFGKDYQISVNINKKDGVINIIKKMQVVNKVENIYNEISLVEAKKISKDCEIGQTVEADFSRLELSSDVMMIVKSSLIKKLTEFTRQNEYEEFSKMIGSCVNGIVKRVLSSGLVVILGKTECFVGKRDLLFQENNSYKVNDKITIGIKEVNRSDKGFQIFGTRANEAFLLSLFKQSIPEIEEGIIEIKAVARDPGSRSKVAVFCLDRTKDPVGLCIGGRGKRISAISKELKDEKIDVVEWSPEPEVLLQNCLKGIQYEGIEKVSNNLIQAVLLPEFISTAIGRKGQNANLISKILGMEVNFITKEEYSNSRVNDFEMKVASIVNIIGVDEIVAKILISEGLDTIVKIINCDPARLSLIQSFNEEIANQIQSRCLDIYNGLMNDDFAKVLIDLNFPIEIIFTMFQNEINTDIALASLSVEDFIDTVGASSISTFRLTKNQISQAIMNKRKELNLI